MISVLTAPAGPMGMPAFMLTSQPMVWDTANSIIKQPTVLAEHILDLETRLPNEQGSQAFADNIVLTLHYLKGDVAAYKIDGQNPVRDTNLNWEKIREPFEATLTLNPGEVFAYHDTILPEFEGLTLKTTNAHYMSKEGFKTFAGLPGNGVCHLASLINWVSKDAGLEVTSKVNHDFYPVPGVPRENGTSIRWGPNGEFNSRNQNLYVKNNFDHPVTFEFEVSMENVKMSVVSDN